MAGRRWTGEELQALEDMSGTFTVATIAKRLGRSFDAVNIKLNHMIKNQKNAGHFVGIDIY